MEKSNTEKKTYEKANAEVVIFDNKDIVRTSGGCETWSNQTGASCYYGLTA